MLNGCLLLSEIVFPFKTMNCLMRNPPGKDNNVTFEAAFAVSAF